MSKKENQLLRPRKKVIHQHPAIWSKKLLWNYWHNKSINIIVCGVFCVPYFFVCMLHGWNCRESSWAIKTLLLPRDRSIDTWGRVMKTERWEVGYVRRGLCWTFTINWQIIVILQATIKPSYIRFVWSSINIAFNFTLDFRKLLALRN